MKRKGVKISIYNSRGRYRLDNFARGPYEKQLGQGFSNPIEFETVGPWFWGKMRINLPNSEN